MSFSTADLAVVAYALVSGADGTSREINSGVKTSRISSGVYNIILPGSENMTDTEPLQQGQGDPKTDYRKDLILVTPIGALSSFPVATLDIDEFTKRVVFGAGNNPDFAILILRPTIPTPTDSSGVQNGPV